MALLMASFILPPAMARGEYQTALEFYSRKQYAQAAPYFEAASISAPENTAANYYAGYCFYAAGHRKEAIKSLWRLIRTSPYCKESPSARALLRQIDPDYATNSGAYPAPATEISAPNAPRTSSGSATLDKRQATSQALDKLVKVIPPASRLPAVSPAYVSRLRLTLETIPLPVLNFLIRNNALITVGSCVSDCDRSIKESNKSSAAVSIGNRVSLGQFKIDQGRGDYVDASNEVGGVRYAVGQVLDFILGNFSDQAEYKRTFIDESKKVPEELHDRLSFYLDRSTGTKATFATLFTNLVGGETTPGAQEVCDLIHQHFPNCEKIVQRRINSLQ